jgi:hypothetical protein
MGVTFFTYTSPGEVEATRLLLKSLRAFGGSLADSAMWIFSSRSSGQITIMDENLQIIPLDVPRQTSHCLFLEKIAACARAEQLASSSSETIVWMNPCCLVVQPPELFELDADHDAAFRPVHIRNVGIPPAQPLDACWRGILDLLKMDDIPTTVTSFVDGRILRSYFNTHAFAMNPSLGLMQQWMELFLQLDKDAEFQASTCNDEIHQVFLFQVLLSCLVVKAIPEPRIAILPSTYNYPCHLHDQVPTSKQLTTLNDAVCVAYENQSFLHGRIRGLEILEPLLSWFQDQV